MRIRRMQAEELAVQEPTPVGTAARIDRNGTE